MPDSFLDKLKAAATAVYNAEKDAERSIAKTTERALGGGAALKEREAKANGVIAKAQGAAKVAGLRGSYNLDKAMPEVIRKRVSISPATAGADKANLAGTPEEFMAGEDAARIPSMALPQGSQAGAAQGMDAGEAAGEPEEGRWEGELDEPSDAQKALDRIEALTSGKKVQ